MKTPFKVTKKEYLEFVNQTNFSDDELEIQISNTINFILLYAQYTSSKNWRKRFEYSAVKTHQLEAFKNAVIYQLAYIESNGGDVVWMNGYNHASNTFVSNGDLFQKYLAPMSKMELANNGILYGGVSIC